MFYIGAKLQILIKDNPLVSYSGAGGQSNAIQNSYVIRKDISTMKIGGDPNVFTLWRQGYVQSSWKPCLVDPRIKN